MITVFIPPPGATAAARQALDGIAEVDDRTLEKFGWSLEQQLVLGKPLAWYPLRAAEELGQLDVTIEAWWTHLLLLEGRPAGTLRVASEGGAHTVDSFAIGRAGPNLLAAFNRAMTWSQDNPTGTPRLLFGFEDEEFGIQSLVIRDSEDHLFPIEPLPEPFEVLVDLSPEAYAIAIHRWRLRLEEREGARRVPLDYAE